MRALTLVGMIVGLLALLVQARGPALLINISPSMPRGVYVVLPQSELKIGDIVEIRLSKRQKAKLGPRSWLSENGTLLKKILASDGASYCVERHMFYVNGINWGPVHTHDSAGLKLPQLSGCLLLKEDEYLVGGEGEHSYDSRNFGPVLRANIIHQAKLLAGF